MLLELHVRGLGVIEDSCIELGPGLTALTGETGAGKTLLVDALDLVMGGRPRRGLVRDNGTALVEAVFVDDAGSEVIVAREIPADGRARAWIDGRQASVAALAEHVADLCDIHGQHEHQSLLHPGAVRRALDAYGGIKTDALADAMAAVRELRREQERLGGDPAQVQREIELIRHQVHELELAAITDPDELDRLLDEAKVLSSAGSLRRSLETALDALEAEGRSSPRDVIATVREELVGFGSLDDVSEQLAALEATMDETASSLRRAAERIEEDPARSDAIDERLRLLHDLCRRFGPSMAEVIERHHALVEELALLEDATERRTSLDARMAEATHALEVAQAEVLAQRLQAAPRMADALRQITATLALERASLELRVSGASGEDVDLLFSANPGLALLPVSKVASGGELSRLMLALRLVLPGGPPTMVFDEVDAGIGGATAVTLASALADVAKERQVLVVTHLAQVAAIADCQVAVVKDTGDGRTGARAAVLSGDERIGEIARMLSGHPDSPTARLHAAELLERGPSPTGQARLV